MATLTQQDRDTLKNYIVNLGMWGPLQGKFEDIVKAAESGKTEWGDGQRGFAMPTNLSTSKTYDPADVSLAKQALIKSGNKNPSDDDAKNYINAQGDNFKTEAKKLTDMKTTTVNGAEVSNDTLAQQKSDAEKATTTNSTVQAQSLPQDSTTTGLNGQAPSEQVKNYAQQHGMSMDQAFNILQSSGQLQGNGTGTAQAPLTTQQMMENQAATGQSGTFTPTAQGKNTLKAYNNATKQWGYVEPGVYVKDVSLQPNPTSNTGATGSTATGATGNNGSTTGGNDFTNGTNAQEIANTNSNFNYGANGATTGNNAGTVAGGTPDYTDIDAGIDADTSLTESQKTMLKAFARQHTGGFDQKSILDTFDKIKKTTIDPYFDQEINKVKTDIGNQFSVLNSNRERELEQQRLTNGNNIRQVKTDLEARGMTNSGEAIKDLGASSAYSQGGQSGAIPGQSAIGANENIGVNAGLTTTTPFGDDQRFYEGTVNQNNRLMSSSTATAYQQAQQQLGQAAENALGTSGAGSLGIAYNSANVGTGSIEKAKQETSGNALNDVINNQSTANDNINKTLQNYNFTY